MTAGFGDDERAEILSLFDADRAGSPVGRSLNPVGFLVFLGAGGLFLALSVLTRRWDLPAGVRSIVFAVIVLGLIAGLGLGFFGGRSGQARARKAAEEALDHLATLFEVSTPLQNRRAAVSLLRNAYYSGGHWVIATIDLDAAKDRLEQAGVLPWLLDVEQFLLDGDRGRPVFTEERPA